MRLMTDALRRRFWLWLLGPVAYEGAVKAHADDLLHDTYHAHRATSPKVKRLYRASTHETGAELRRLGVSQDEVDTIRGRARLLPNLPEATAIFLDGELVGFSNDWRATAPANGPNALRIHTTTGGL